MTSGLPSAPLLSLQQVEKRYDTGTLALAGVSLDLAAGSFVSLLGPSGCGKSTILRLIAGLSRPTSGRITWATPSGSPAPRISCVFQEPTLMPWSTVLANVTLPLVLTGVKAPEAAERARAALLSVGLLGFEAAYPRELSGGMKMRVSLARAMVTEPDVLLLDEPFAALDEITRHKLTNDLAGLWRSRHFTAVFVTHSVFESVYLSERVVVLAARPGRISADLAIETTAIRDDAFRTSPLYTALCANLSEALRTAMTS